MRQSKHPNRVCNANCVWQQESAIWGRESEDSTHRAQLQTEVEWVGSEQWRSIARNKVTCCDGSWRTVQNENKPGDPKTSMLRSAIRVMWMHNCIKQILWHYLEMTRTIINTMYMHQYIMQVRWHLEMKMTLISIMYTMHNKSNVYRITLSNYSDIILKW